MKISPNRILPLALVPALVPALALLSVLSLASCLPLTVELPGAPGSVAATGLNLLVDGTPVGASLVMTVGSSKTVEARLTPANSTDTVAWSSTDAVNVPVSPSGTVTVAAQPSHAVTITASAGSRSASFVVVVSVPATSVELYPTMDGVVFYATPAVKGTTVTISSGTAIWVGAKVFPVGSTDPLVWSSSDPYEVNVLDQAPAQQSGNLVPGPNAVQAPATVLVDSKKSIYVAHNLTHAVVITATAGAQSASFTLYYNPVIPADDVVGYRSWDGGDTYVQDTGNAGEYFTGDDAYYQVQISPANTTDSVVWTCSDEDTVSLGTPITEQGPGGAYLVSSLAVHVNTDFPAPVTLTATVGNVAYVFTLGPPNP